MFTMSRCVMLVSMLVFCSTLVTAAPGPQLDSVFGDITSGAASVAGVVASGATSVAGDVTHGANDVFQTVTSVGGSAVTLITSAGGRAVTLGASGATGAVGDVTSFYASATAAAGSNGASHMAVLTFPLWTTLVTVLAGILGGAWAIL